MKPQRIGTLGLLTLLALVPPKTLCAEVRTIQEHDASPQSWSETLVTKAGAVRRKGGTAIEFSIVATGVQAFFMPKMTVWLSPDGQLLAQETLPAPPSGPPPEPGKGKGKREGCLRLVLQEVTGSAP